MLYKTNSLEYRVVAGCVKPGTLCLFFFSMAPV